MCTPGEETRFRCELMKAKDGGKPYLFVIGVEKVSTMTVTPSRFGIKFELGRSLIYNKAFHDHDEHNETHRLRVPPLYPVSEIDHVYSSVLPNFYAECKGVQFFGSIREQ